MSNAPTLGEVEESAHDTMRAVMQEFSDKADTADETKVPAELAEHKTAVGIEETAVGEGASEIKLPRDQLGRFVKATPSEETAPIEADSEEVAGASRTEEIDDLEPPYDWSAAEQEVFRSLPTGAKSLVLERVNEARQATQWAVENSRKYNALEQVLADKRNAWARDGLDEAGAIRQLIGLSDYATQNPTEFIRWFAQQRGLSPDQIFQAQQPDQGGFVDPEVAALRRELTGIQQHFQTQQQAAMQMQEHQLRNELQQFVEAKDDNGRLKHPYFNEVRTLMGSFYGSGQPIDLDQAYDMACRAHPEVFAKIDAARRADADRERAKQQREKAAAAKQAGSSIVGTPAERGQSEPSGDIREDMRRLFAERGAL